MTIYNHYTIYKITNLINNKVYIGQTIQKPLYRWATHKRAAKNGVLKYPLYLALRKHGIENFTFTPICVCYDKTRLDQLENRLILTYRSNEKKFGYNCDTGGKIKKKNYKTIEKAKNAYNKDDNKSIDQKKYTWYHPKYGAVTCTRIKLIEKYPALSSSELGVVIKGIYIHHKFWGLKENLTKKKKLKLDNLWFYDNEKYMWFSHAYGKVFCSRRELIENFPEQNLNPNALRVVIDRTTYSHKNWFLYDVISTDSIKMKTDLRKFNWLHPVFGNKFCSRKELIKQFPEQKLNTWYLGRVIKRKQSHHKNWCIL